MPSDGMTLNIVWRLGTASEVLGPSTVARVNYYGFSRLFTPFSGT